MDGDFLWLVVGMLGVVVVLFSRHIYIGGFLTIASFMSYLVLQEAASWIAFLILLAGIAMMGLEIVIPGFGILGVTGGVCTYLGLYVGNGNLADTFFDVAMAIMMTVVVVYILLKRGAKIQRFQGFVLKPSLTHQRGYSTSKAYDFLLHQTGRTLTVLRPSGKVMIGDEIYDVVSTGMVIPEKIPIQVTKVEGNKIIVREVVK